MFRFFLPLKVSFGLILLFFYSAVIFLNLCVLIFWGILIACSLYFTNNIRIHSVEFIYDNTLIAFFFNVFSLANKSIKLIDNFSAFLFIKKFALYSCRCMGTFSFIRLCGNQSWSKSK